MDTAEPTDPEDASVVLARRIDALRWETEEMTERIHQLLRRGRLTLAGARLGLPLVYSAGTARGAESRNAE